MAGAKSDMSEQEIQQKEHLAFFAVLAAFAKGVPATLSKNQIRILEKLLEALNISEKIKKSVRKMLAAGKVTKASRDEVYSRAAGRSKKRHRRPPPTLGDGFDVGAALDCLDSTGKTWSAARVLDRTAGEVLVHYHGWNARWDEWVPTASPRVALPGTHVPRNPYLAKQQREQQQR
uniref:Tudor-knot domain-containing protein n=1 Tax=Heterosigma akashiwo TaxID=2829 RepID=A0A6V1WD52_HETAK